MTFLWVCDKLTPEDPYQQAYMRLRKILEEFYSPMPLEIAENFRFHQRKQREEESLQEYIVALQKLSVNCKFGDYLKTALRNQFVFGLRSRRIQARLLETKELNFQKAVEIATSMELSEEDANQLQANFKPNEVHSLNYTKKKQTTKQEGKLRPFSSRVDEPKNIHRGSSTSGPSNTYTANKNIKCFRCGGAALATKTTLPR